MDIRKSVKQPFRLRGNVVKLTTTPTVLTDSKFGGAVIIFNAAGPLEAQLPKVGPGNKGATFTFVVGVSGAHRADPNIADVIHVTTSVAGQAVVAPAVVGALITLVSDGVNAWYPVNHFGAWTKAA